MIGLLALLSVQGDVIMEPRDKRVADMLQLTIELPETVTPDERSRMLTTFKSDAIRIRNCADAQRLADRYRQETSFAATIVTRSDHPIGWMPPALHDELVALPVGHATKVYGDRTAPRILVACSAPKLLPNGVAPPTP